KKVMAETEELADTSTNQNKAWKTKVTQAADQQFQLATETQRLLDKLQKAHEDEAKKNPDIAKLIEGELQLAEENRLVGAMKDADKQLRDYQPKQALQKNQEKCIETLKDMVEALTEKRENQLEKLIKQQKDAQGGLNEFIDRLEKLKKDVEEAKKI